MQRQTLAAFDSHAAFQMKQFETNISGIEVQAQQFAANIVQYGHGLETRCLDLDLDLEIESSNTNSFELCLDVNMLRHFTTVWAEVNQQLTVQGGCDKYSSAFITLETMVSKAKQLMKARWQRQMYGFVRHLKQPAEPFQHRFVVDLNMEIDRPFAGFAISPDGSKVVITEFLHIYVVELPSGKRVMPDVQHDVRDVRIGFGELCFTPAGNLLVIVLDEKQCWVVEMTVNGRTVRTLCSTARNLHPRLSSWTRTVDCNDQVVVTSHGDNVRVWDFGSGELLRSIGDDDATFGKFLRFSLAKLLPGGKFLIIADKQKQVCALCDVHTGQRIEQFWLTGGDGWCDIVPLPETGTNGKFLMAAFELRHGMRILNTAGGTVVKSGTDETLGRVGAVRFGRLWFVDGNQTLYVYE